MDAKMRLPAAALAISLATPFLGSVLVLVRNLLPNSDARTAVVVVLLALFLGCWPLGVGLSVYANRGGAGLEGAPRTVARAALGASLGTTVLASIGCLLFTVLVFGLSLR